MTNQKRSIKSGILASVLLGVTLEIGDAISELREMTPEDRDELVRSLETGAARFDLKEFAKSVLSRAAQIHEEINCTPYEEE